MYFCRWRAGPTSSAGYTGFFPRFHLSEHKERLASLLGHLSLRPHPARPDFLPPATPGGSVSPPRDDVGQQADLLRGDVTPFHVSAAEEENRWTGRFFLNSFCKVFSPHVAHCGNCSLKMC